MTITNFPRADIIIQKLGLFYPGFQRFYAEFTIEERSRYKGELESMLVDYSPAVLAFKVRNAIKGFAGRSGWPSIHDIVHASQYEEQPKKRVFLDEAIAEVKNKAEIKDTRWQQLMMMLRPELRPEKYKNLPYTPDAYKTQEEYNPSDQSPEACNTREYVASVKRILLTKKGSPESMLAWGEFKKVREKHNQQEKSYA